MTNAVPLKRIAGYTALVLATLAVLFVLFLQLGEVVLLFVLSIIVAAAMRKGVILLERRRLPRSLAILTWYLLIIGVVAAGVYFMGKSFQADLQFAVETLPAFYDGVIKRWLAGGVDWQQAIASRLPTTETLYEAIGEDSTTVGFQLLGVTSGVLSIVVSLVAVLTLTYYWLADQERFERIWLTLLPIQQRSIARTTWRGIETQVGAYVRSEALQFVLTVAVLWLSFRALGVPYATLLAVYAGFAQLIPWIGIPLTVLPLLSMLLTETSILPIALAIGVVVLTGLLMDRFVEPTISAGTKAHPILVITALLMMADAGGLLGMIVALPLAATFQIVVSSVIRTNSMARGATATQESAQLQELRSRMGVLHHDLPAESKQRRALEDLLARLDGLLTKAEVLVRERPSVISDQRFTPSRARPRGISIFQRRGE